MARDTLRLLVDGPLTGPVNMARDEALLAVVGAGAAAPTLRLYAWSPATISLGYFQSAADFDALPPPACRLALVRRTTGGGAILHDRELTYSLTLPVGHAWLAAGATALYEQVHRAIIRAVGGRARLYGLRDPSGAPMACGEDGADGENVAVQGDSERRGVQAGPFFCFARRHALDVVVDAADGTTRKLAGSAQRRARQAVLQHGSFILDSRFAQQPCATWGELGGPREFDEAASRFVAALTAATGCSTTADAWADSELAAAETLVAKYAGRVWNRAR